MEIVWQNTALVAVPNLSAVAAGVLFALDPVLAIVINNGSAILAELNGLRPLLGPGNLSPLQQSLSADALSQEITRWQEQPEQMITSTSSLSVNEPAASEPAVSTTAATVFSPNQDAQDANRSAGLTQSELARRLGVAAKTLTRRRNSRSFAEWSQQKDPEKLSWNYQPDAQRFYPVSESQEAVERRSSQQRSHEHSSQSYPSRDPRPSRPQKPRLKSVS
jgi:Cu2+-exporting ATPase